MQRQAVCTFRSGQTFGEVSLLHHSPRGASVRAKDDVTLLVIDRYGADLFGQVAIFPLVLLFVCMNFWF
jgi:hypothetical protein